MDKRVVLGFSGGVDSAVAALLLQRAGYAVEGLFLDVGVAGAEADARAAAAALGVPLAVRDARAALERFVCAPFLEGYLAGRTLNPCLICNPAVKFQALIERADALGFEHIATGHYAVHRDGALLMGHPDNDQSYQLALTRRAQLNRLLLPLADLPKPRVRDLAREAGLPIANKPDSMDICFIPDHDYAGWIERRCAAPGPGDALFDRRVIGRHDGIHRYTVGQRYPELYRERRLYVSEIRPERNELVLALWETLFRQELRVTDVNWLVDPPDEPFRGRVRARHTRWETPDCTITREGQAVRVVTDTPLRAPAPGQVAALYRGDQLLGGGLIDAVV